MKHIRKGAEPAELAAWRREHVDGAPVAPTWEELDAEVQRALKRALMEEQGYLCCYCTRRIVDGDSHIEHLVPRNAKTGDPSLTFAYENLLASCQQNLLRKDPRHCGIAKDEWYDRDLMVSPLDERCEPRFRFDADGEVDAADAGDQGAIDTIDHLKLKCAKLKNLRKGVIDGLFEDLAVEPEPEGWRRLAAALRERGADGRFAPFCVVQVAVIEAMLGGRQATGGGT